ncbi:TPA: Rha family transcriptional regulator [Enterococcus faecium]|uniref:Phage anti-repressor protein n=5 Tax=Enterococcus faecium TaxID=1352 RepID=A0ABD7LN90_ENTFC|nr:MULTISPECIES: Rha family transcriptional regulator [Bacilli]APE39864.1 phage regulatory protein [Enterococcus faecium]EKC6605185.1 Rha family transcriptional regulator [Enterococcus faecium]EKC6617862.1 Rha family transcriptional regulator [Enterococcus faecium]EKC6620255.1 Rha family transcriptional regulator [Enterococcus faecium]EKC6629202.1 Rha family transcriptional regulator [Enterococcus faecium]
MQELVILKNKEAVTTSLQVAESFDKKHRHVLTAIDELKEGVAENWADLFWEDTYVHPQNKQSYRIIYMNRDGFSLLAMGFTGKKALSFKLQYIEAFNKMEKELKDQLPSIPATKREMALLALAANEETNERVDAIESDLNDLKNNQLLAEPDYRTISNMVRNKIRVICNQQHLNSKAKAELFKDLNGGIKRITGAVARNRIKAKQFDDVIDFINNWMPSTATMTIIKQMELLEDE